MADNVRALRGTHPERATTRTKKATVKLKPSVPEPPADLDAEALAEWGRIVGELDEKGLLAAVDRGILASYCRAWSNACLAQELLSVGLLVDDKNGDVRKSPAWQIWREATALSAALAKELLITPSSRLRATMPEAGDGPTAESILD